MFKIFRKKSELTPHPVAISYISAIKEDPTRLSATKWIQVKQYLLEELSIEEREWVAAEIKKIRLDHLSVEIARLRLTGDTGEDQRHIRTGSILGLDDYNTPIKRARI